ncbi:MAG: peptide/nickel transport system permease protein, partial [Paracoccaceae bacterium]
MRVAQTVPVVVGVVLVSFLLTRALPGDPAVQFAGAAATEQSLAEIRSVLGLDKSLPQQFAIYVSDLAQGDLGRSMSTGQPVLDDLTRRLPASLELTLIALLL